MINPNDPAFSFVDENGGSYEDRQVYLGLSIRAELAARAMQGILSSNTGNEWMKPEICAQYSIKYANALIEELNK